jgi:hypothetical protein
MSLDISRPFAYTGEIFFSSYVIPSSVHSYLKFLIKFQAAKE